MRNLPDKADIAGKLRDHIKGEASTNMPAPVSLSVYDGSRQFTDGYVWAFDGDKRVQCIAPGPLDLTAATLATQIVVSALPPNPDEPGASYFLIGGGISGATNSRAPALMTTGITIIGGGGGGSGTVTSVALSVPAPFSVSGSPITTAGTLTVTQPTPFVETQGGTGQSTFTQGDILYASAANTLSKLAKGTSGFFLKIGATIPAWAQVFYQTIKKAGSAVTQRSNINFIDGGNVTITVADNSGTDATDVTIAAAAPGGGGVAPARSEIVAWMGLFS